MLCDKCKQNEATVHIKEFHNGKCTVTNLCAQCANSAKVDGAIPGIGFNLAEAILNFSKMTQEITAEHKADSPVCPVCGWNTEKIRNNDGKVGCPECYRTFGKLIKDAVSQVQRGSIHLGKRPGGTSANSPALKRNELEHLKKELRQLVAREEYEAAAICRDRINALKAELDDIEDGEEK